jgi:hypothetical protein
MRRWTAAVPEAALSGTFIERFGADDRPKLDLAREDEER